MERSDKLSGSIDVTVLIAAFNAGPFISRAIFSALSQGGVNVEVLVVNDCSTDDTATVVRKFDDRRVRIIDQPSNSGPGAARNAGLRSAAGRWVAILDADDAFEDGRLAALIQAAEEDSADIIADNFVFYDLANLQRSAPALKMEPSETWVNLLTFVENSRPYKSEADYGLLKPVIRSEVINRLELAYPEDVRHGEDFVMIFNALLKGAKYLVQRRTVGYIYTTRSSGLSRTIVDYNSQICAAQQQSRAFRGKNAALTKAFRKRGAALSRLSAERKVEDLWRRKSLQPLLQMTGTDPYVAIEVCRRGLRFLRKRIRTDYSSRLKA